jgi:hypothetical protein
VMKGEEGAGEQIMKLDLPAHRFLFNKAIRKRVEDNS